MPGKHRVHGGHTSKRAYKSAVGSGRLPAKPRTSTKVVHSTPPSSASEIRESLGIPKSDVKAAIEAIDSVL